MSEQAKPSTDWERVETDYRIGTKSLREIAEDQGITEGAIRKRAKRDEWTRDLTAKVRMRADELVRKELVRTEVRKEYANEKETVEVEAKVQARIQLAHRASIGRNQALVLALLDELESITGSKELFEQLGELMYAPDDKGQDKRNALYQKVIELPTRIDGTKKLAETMKILIGLERQAFGIADNAEGDKPAKPIDSNESADSIARKLAFILSKAANAG